MTDLEETGTSPRHSLPLCRWDHSTHCCEKNREGKQGAQMWGALWEGGLCPVYPPRSTTQARPQGRTGQASESRDCGAHFWVSCVFPSQTLHRRGDSVEMVTRSITYVLPHQRGKNLMSGKFYSIWSFSSPLHSFVSFYCVLLEGLKTWGKEVSGLNHHQSHCFHWDVPRPLWSLAVCSHECLLQSPGCRSCQVSMPGLQTHVPLFSVLCVSLWSPWEAVSDHFRLIPTHRHCKFRLIT